MKRRAFLAALAAAGIASKLPALNASPPRHAAKRPAKRVTQVKRLMQQFDYDFYTAICIQFDIDGGLARGGPKFRLACSMETDTWNSFTDAQREECWRMLEANAMREALKRGEVVA